MERDDGPEGVEDVHDAFRLAGAARGEEHECRAMCADSGHARFCPGDFSDLDITVEQDRIHAHLMR